jgi:hypothetical protein
MRKLDSSQNSALTIVSKGSKDAIHRQAKATLGDSMTSLRRGYIPDHRKTQGYC